MVLGVFQQLKISAGKFTEFGMRSADANSLRVVDIQVVSWQGFVEV